MNVVGPPASCTSAPRLVACQYRLAAPDLPIAVADRRRHVLDLVPLGLALVDAAAEPPERFQKEGGNVVRLQSAGVHPLHVRADLTDARHVHRIVGQSPALNQLP
jgi:hypothetical protein